MSRPDTATVDGLITRASLYPPAETMNRFIAAVEQQRMQVFARIDHAGAAERVGMTLRPTELPIFGSLSAGTRLMQAAQTIGIDLPLKALVYQDEDGTTRISFNDLAVIAARHGIRETMADRLSAMMRALEAIAHEASGIASRCP